MRGNSMRRKLEALRRELKDKQKQEGGLLLASPAGEGLYEVTGRVMDRGQLVKASARAGHPVIVLDLL